MAILVGFILLILMMLIYGLIENYLTPNFNAEFNADGVLGIIILVVFLYVGIIGWGLTEIVMQKVLDQKYSDNFFTRALQVLHSIMAVIIAFRGAALWIAVYGVIIIGVFFNWLLFG